jgi:DNA-binding MarR family transcriptional regulator
MADYDLLTSLLPLLSRYQQENSGAKGNSVEDFANWIHEWALSQKQYKDKRLPEETDPAVPRGENTEVTLGKLVYYMYRYARFYTKKALKNSVLNSLDEFTFLVTMLHTDAITKTELINKMVYDKTTGIELINRLVKQGLVAEAENPADKRSKLIKITDVGRMTLFASFEELGKVSRIIPGNLTAEELHTLIHLLDKLDHHHLHIWDQHKDSDLDTILAS